MRNKTEKWKGNFSLGANDLIRREAHSSSHWHAPSLIARLIFKIFVQTGGNWNLSTFTVSHHTPLFTDTSAHWSSTETVTRVCIARQTSSLITSHFKAAAPVLSFVPKTFTKTTTLNLYVIWASCNLELRTSTRWPNGRRIASYVDKGPHNDVCAHIHRFNGHFPRKPGLADCLLDSQSPVILIVSVQAENSLYPSFWCRQVGCLQGDWLV